MSRSIPTKRVAMRGFSLIELMVGLVIATLVILFVAAIFAGASTGFRAIDERSQLQDRGRIALDVVADAARRAGFFGSYSLSYYGEAFQGNNYGMGVTAAAAYPSWAPLSPAVNVSSVLTGGSGTSIVLGSGSTITPVGTSDVITVQYGGPGASVSTSMTAGSDNIAVAGGVRVYFSGQPFVIANSSSATLFRVDNGLDLPGGSGTNVANISHDPGLSKNTSSFLTTYAKGAQVMPLERLTYFVGIDSGGVSSLYVWDRKQANSINVQPVVGGIESMRIAYGLDTDNDNQVDTLRATADMTATDWANVRSVRFSLVVKSDSQNVSVSSTGSTNAPRFAYDATTFAFLPVASSVSPDGAIRSAFTRSVTVRNTMRAPIDG